MDEMPDGELRRCTVAVRKPLAEKHYQQRKHSSKIAQVDDLVLSEHRRQGTPQPSVDGGMTVVHQETAVRT
jgi:hypothetical protein